MKKFINSGQFRKGFIPWNKGVKGVMIAWNKGLKMPQISGKNNYHWGGNKIGYSGIHLWIPKVYGKAGKCESQLVNLICSNISKNFEWAKLKSKKYERKRENFIQLCVSCHRKYDMTEKRKKQLSETGKLLIGKKNPFYGKKHTEESKQKMSQKLIGKTAWLKGKKVDRIKYPNMGHWKRNSIKQLAI